jgi:hypothetical protein
MNALLLYALTTVQPVDVQPVLWLKGDGSLPPGLTRILPGVASVSCPAGTAFSFTGARPGIEIEDQERFRLTKSVSISAWLFLNDYGKDDNTAPGGQVLFRGDDHSGRDPYHLTVVRDGTIAFVVEDGTTGALVVAPIPRMRWTHVLGTLDHATGGMRLYLNGSVAAFTTTKVRPLGDLDPRARSGIGIGNVQAPSSGRHNQALQGMIFDLRLFDRPVTPAQAGWRRDHVLFTGD